MRRPSPSHKSGLFENAIANIPRGGQGASTRSRSVFERLDQVPGSPPSRRRTVRAASPYSHRRVTLDVGSKGRDNTGRRTEWRHDRFEEQSPSSNGISSTVFVRGLAMDVSDESLRSLFEDAGCEVCMVKVERAPLTTAVVGFSRRDHAIKAVEKVHGQRLMGSRIRVMVWNRDDAAAIKALQDRRATDREEELQMKQELMQMQRSKSPDSRMNAWGASSRRATMAHLAPKQSVFERVS